MRNFTLKMIALSAAVWVAVCITDGSYTSSEARECRVGPRRVMSCCPNGFKFAAGRACKR